MEIKIDLPYNTSADYNLILAFVKTIINVYREYRARAKK